MSRCFIEGTGGAAKLFAAIGVTYPAGSVVACTNGTKALKAKTTTGQWIFAIPEPGIWTVTASDDTKSKAKIVEITSEGQFETVKLSFDYTIFDGVFADGYGLSSASIIPAVDVTEYDRLSITGRQSWQAYNTNSKVGLSASIDGELAAAATFIANEAEKTIDVDTSALEGLYYIVGVGAASLAEGILTFESSAVRQEVRKIEFS